MKAQVVVIVVVVMLATAVLTHARACMEGRTGYNGCNTCTCFNGVVICTRRQCMRPDRCEGRNGSWMDNCHRCTCVSGRSHCVLEPKCVLGQGYYPSCTGVVMYLYECNMCWCGGRSTHPACTYMGCPSEFDSMLPWWWINNTSP